MREPTVYMHAQPGRVKTIGYCMHHKHFGALSLKMLKNHECLKKQCPFFKRNEEHQYWVDRAKKREDKKAREKAEKVREIIIFGTADEISERLTGLFFKDF